MKKGKWVLRHTGRYEVSIVSWENLCEIKKFFIKESELQETVENFNKEYGIKSNYELKFKELVELDYE